MYRNSDQNPEPKSTQAVPYQDQSQPVGYCPPSPGMELARAYVPIQRLGQVYPPGKALEVGTMFPELYRPYHY